MNLRTHGRPGCDGSIPRLLLMIQSNEDHVGVCDSAACKSAAEGGPLEGPVAVASEDEFVFAGKKRSMYLPFSEAVSNRARRTSLLALLSNL